MPEKMDKADLRLTLLRATLEHAIERSPYYGETLSEVDTAALTRQSFAAVPILTREALAAHTWEIATAREPPGYVRITSGRSFGAGREAGPVLLHLHSRQERDTLEALRERTMARMGRRPLVLRLINANHGREVGGPYPGVFELPLEKPYHLRAVIDLLSRYHDFDGFGSRIEVLAGPLNMLKLLTRALAEDGRTGHDYGIRLLLSHSWQITSSWHKELTGYWGADMLNVYGLSEVPGLHADECADCGGFHFSPLAYIETVDPGTYEPTDSGVARLVVTTLYPLGDLQPLVRYDTGDLIEPVRPCPSGQLGYRLVGRASQVPLTDERPRRAILEPFVVNELLDGRQEVAHHVNPRAANFGLKRAFGWPKYELDVHRGEEGDWFADLRVELTFDPAKAPERTASLRTAIRDAVTACGAAGSARLDVRIAFADPGESSYATLL